VCGVLRSGEGAAADGEAVITDTAIAGKSTAASNVMMRKCRPE